MLEAKVSRLTIETQKLREVNRANQDYLKKISVPEQIINGYFVGKTNIYERMADMLNLPDTE